MSVITNTTVLSNVARIGELSLLQRLFGQLALPTEVYAEIQRLRPKGTPSSTESNNTSRPSRPTAGSSSSV